MRPVSTRLKSGRGRKPRARDLILDIIKSHPGICREDIWVETRLGVSWASICRNTLWLEKAGLVTFTRANLVEPKLYTYIGD